VGWLDLVQLRHAVRVNGLTDIAITKLDILAGYNEISVCTAYEIDGKIRREMPASVYELRAAKPIYEKLTGWQNMSGDDIAKIIAGGYDALPENIKKYLEFIEKEIDCPITIISLGPKRAETIVR
jgi:adenylosuccinate synthase